MMAWVKKINQEDHSTLNIVIDLCQWDEELKLKRKDWALINKFLALFKPIQLMSNQLSGEKYSSIHMVLPTIMDIKEYIEGLKTDKLIVKTVKTLQKEFENYFRYSNISKYFCLIDFTFARPAQPLYAVATFLSPLQSNDLSEPEKKIARDHLKAEVQKLEDYMGEEAIETNDKIGGVEDHEEVYIPGAGHLGKLNNRDFRRLNQEADFDTRYIMLCYQVSVLLYFYQITDLGRPGKVREGLC